MQLTNIGFYLGIHSQQYICKAKISMREPTHHTSHLHTNVALRTHDAYYMRAVTSVTSTSQAPFRDGILGMLGPKSLRDPAHARGPEEGDPKERMM